MRRRRWRWLRLSRTSTPRGAKGETTANDAAYTAYLCMAAAAEDIFGDATGYAGITAYLTDSYAAGMGALAAGGTAMSLDGFDEGVYSLYAPFKQPESGEGSLADGDYIAVVAYADGAENMFRVFESTASEGKMAFKLTTEGGTAGDWTVAVPEPTSGLLLLLGFAGLALRRKRA